jgi:hypothetical protein
VFVASRSRETDEEEQGGSMSGEAGDPTSGTDSEGARVQRESTLRIQEGGEASQDSAEDSGQGEYGPRGCVDSEGVRFQKEHVVSE